jgi:hypothetical protein
MWLGGLSFSAAFQPYRIPIRFDNRLRETDTYPFKRSLISLNLKSSSARAPEFNIRSQTAADAYKLEWLQQATDRVVAQTAPGSLTEGKWHEVVSLLKGWSCYQKTCHESAARMEALLKVLVNEQRAGNSAITISMDLYNHVLDAWACAALFGTMSHPELASQRAREILVTVQETYEQETKAWQASLGSSDDESPRNADTLSLSILKPNAKSFNLVLHAVRKAEGVFVARRVLAWMEYLYKSGKNINARPVRSDYLQILDAYGKVTTSSPPHAGVLAEAFLRHIKCQVHAVVENEIPDTVCYNIVIRAWSRQRRGRESAEHADRLLEEMKALPSDHGKPNEVTYSSTYCTKCVRGLAKCGASNICVFHMGSRYRSLGSVWHESARSAASRRTASGSRRLRRFGSEHGNSQFSHVCLGKVQKSRGGWADRRDTSSNGNFIDRKS